MNKSRALASMTLLSVILALHPLPGFAGNRAKAEPHGQLIMSRAEYLDRVRAIWTAQMIGQRTGVLFEHKPASVLGNTPLVRAKGFAPTDDDYYYEMVAIRALGIRNRSHSRAIGSPVAGE